MGQPNDTEAAMTVWSEPHHHQQDETAHYPQSRKTVLARRRTMEHEHLVTNHQHEVSVQSEIYPLEHTHWAVAFADSHAR